MSVVGDADEKSTEVSVLTCSQCKIAVRAETAASAVEDDGRSEDSRHPRAASASRAFCTIYVTSITMDVRARSDLT